MKESEKFEEWFKGFFMCSREPSSPLLVSDNKAFEARSTRIMEVCKMILDNPKMDDDTLRKEIALRFFITMRGALDYLNYSKMVIQKYYQQ